MLGVSANYFSTLGITIRSGRAFTDRDRAGSEPIVIVSESLAGRLWPGSPVIDNRLRIAPPAGETQSVPVAHVVVGIAGDVRQAHADDNLHDVYVPLMQNAGRFAILYLPTGPLSPGAERDLRQAVAAVHAEVAVAAPRMLSSAIDQERSRPRFLAFMLVGFAAFAALLALLGMYGVVAYAVRQREQEIAVRMAVGADRRAITWLFLRQGGLVLIAGLAAGVLGAMGMSRVLEAQLFGVDRTDPRVLALTVVSMAVCGLIAVWWPARRAASTDPAMALKTE